MPTRLHRETTHARELDALIGKLIAEIAALIKNIFTAVNAGERPSVCVKGVLDAVTAIQLFAERRRS